MDHAISFQGFDWLLLVDAYSKFPFVQKVSSVSSHVTIKKLAEVFAIFGYPHALVSDNATSFTSDEFKQWADVSGIVLLTGAPFHPSTNGQAERFVQSFKKSVAKGLSNLSLDEAVLEFLMAYRRTPLAGGQSPAELLLGRSIRAPIDLILPSPIHLRQQKSCVQVQVVRTLTWFV